MKLYATYWTDPETLTERSTWTTSQGGASKAATAAKTELRNHPDGAPKSVGYLAIEVDTRKEGLVEFLNILASGVGVAAAHTKLTAK